MDIILTTPDNLRALIQEAVKEAMPQKVEEKNLPDTITLETAVALLEEYGFPTSKGKIYKLTSSGEMPFRKYGRKLVFSRKELIAWAESRTKRKNDRAEAALRIARSANRKIHRYGK
ncbi:MAG: helix-turn-helix domain-containing protein [Tannerellaceae bacterium]|jgi:excisionase family DNA binding protein|nr:helix-turn-helix domain-containing protein [Tannerellaceae bacterium]